MRVLMETPTLTSEEALRAEIRRLGPWHQDVEIAPGVRTDEPVPGNPDPLGIGTSDLIDTDLVISRFVANLFPGGFAGRSVLDCACNAGGYLLAAKQNGAGRCFGFDVREHWLNQARFVAQHRPSEGVEFAQCDLLELRERGLEPFDVTFFMGIFYHLPDPVAGLRIAADLTRELLVLNTAVDGQGHGDALTLSLESETALMSGVHRLAWLPTSAKVLQEILRWCGFPHTRVDHVIRKHPKFHRMQIFAAREAKTFAHYDTVRPETLHLPRKMPLWKRGLRRLVR